MRSFKINDPSSILLALFWVKENGSDFWCPVTGDGIKTSNSKFNDSDILDGLFCGKFLVNDEKLQFEFVTVKSLVIKGSVGQSADMAI